MSMKPLTFVGVYFQGNAWANFIAKAFLVGYGSQAALTLVPMLADPASIIVAFTSRVFVYAFFNNALGKALVAAWAIVLSNPLEQPPTISTVDASKMPAPSSPPAIQSTALPEVKP